MDLGLGAHAGRASARRAGVLVLSVTVVLAFAGPVAQARSASSAAGEDSSIEWLPAPPLAVRGDAAFVWTGEELVVWGGDVEAANMGLPGPDRNYRDGAVFDPATRAWRKLPRAPLPKSAETAVGTATDRDVVVARGRSVARWNPRANTWRAVHDAPDAVRDLTFIGTGVISMSANAVLNLRSGRWHRLPVPPVRLERQKSTWTGSELVILGGPEPPFARAAAIAFDPRTNQWRELPSPPEDLSSEALGSAWDGRRVVVLNYDLVAAAYTPETDSWQTLPPLPARFIETVPTVRTVAPSRIVVFMGQAVVVLDESERWVPLPYNGLPRGAVAATNPAGRGADRELFAAGLEDRRIVIATVDIGQVIAAPRLIQVGVATVVLPPGVALVGTRGEPNAPVYSSEAVLAGPQGERCTVVSTYEAFAQPSDTGLIDSPHVFRNAEGETVTWKRSEDGLTWQVAATTSDTVAIRCDQPTLGEELARGASLPDR